MSELDEIRDYFSIELSQLENQYNQKDKTNNTGLGLSLTIISIGVSFSSVMAPLIFNGYFDVNKELFNLLKIIVLAPLISIFFVIANYLYIKHIEGNHYIELKTSLEIIIRYLLFLKIKNHNRFLGPLRKRISQDWEDIRYKGIKSRKEYRKFEKERLEEYIVLINDLNNMVRMNL